MNLAQSTTAIWRTRLWPASVWGVWVVVFPEGEEILIGGARSAVVGLQGVSTAQLEMSECADGIVEHDPAMRSKILAASLRTSSN